MNGNFAINGSTDTFYDQTGNNNLIKMEKSSFERLGQTFQNNYVVLEFLFDSKFLAFSQKSSQDRKQFTDNFKTAFNLSGLFRDYNADNLSCTTQSVCKQLVQLQNGGAHEPEKHLPSLLLE